MGAGCGCKLLPWLLQLSAPRQMAGCTASLPTSPVTAPAPPPPCPTTAPPNRRPAAPTARRHRAKTAARRDELHAGLLSRGHSQEAADQMMSGGDSGVFVVRAASWGGRGWEACRTGPACMRRGARQPSAVRVRGRQLAHCCSPPQWGFNDRQPVAQACDHLELMEFMRYGPAAAHYMRAFASDTWRPSKRSVRGGGLPGPRPLPGAPAAARGSPVRCPGLTHLPSCVLALCSMSG